jgi:uncharacterized protein (DUF885 family)
MTQWASPASLPVVPGQAASGLIGILDTQRCRKYAEETPGDGLYMGKFHDPVRVNGGVRPAMIGAVVLSWFKNKQT